MAQDTLTEQPVTVTENEQPISEEQEGTNYYQPIGERLGIYSITLTNALSDSSIQLTLKSFNYTPEKIAQGTVLLQNARAADARNAKEYGEQYAATELLEKEMQEASILYDVSLRVARIAFKKDRDAQKSLMLNGRRSGSINGWIRQADVFYRNILESETLMSRMAEFGRTREVLETEYKEVNDVARAFASQKKEMGDAVRSTEERDNRMEELEEWMSDFIGIIRIAFAKSPEALRKLGL